MKLKLYSLANSICWQGPATSKYPWVIAGCFAALPQRGGGLADRCFHDPPWPMTGHKGSLPIYTLAPWQGLADRFSRWSLPIRKLKWQKWLRRYTSPFWKNKILNDLFDSIPIGPYTCCCPLFQWPCGGLPLHLDLVLIWLISYLSFALYLDAPFHVPYPMFY